MVWSYFLYSTIFILELVASPSEFALDFDGESFLPSELLPVLSDSCEVFSG